MGNVHSFEPSNPWPEPVPDTASPGGRVWRTWIVETEKNMVDVEDVQNLFLGDSDVRVELRSAHVVAVGIRSDDPKTCDIHEVMIRTRQILMGVHAVAPIVRLQGVLLSDWLFIRM